jgi:hypothetical protein
MTRVDLFAARTSCGIPTNFEGSPISKFSLLTMMRRRDGGIVDRLHDDDAHYHTIELVSTPSHRSLFP